MFRNKLSSSMLISRNILQLSKKSLPFRQKNKENNQSCSKKLTKTSLCLTCGVTRMPWQLTQKPPRRMQIQRLVRKKMKSTELLLMIGNILTLNSRKNNTAETGTSSKKLSVLACYSEMKLVRQLLIILLEKKFRQLRGEEDP